MTAQIEHLKACCQKVVAAYCALYNPPRLNTALFCPICTSRIVNLGSSWENE